MTPSKPPMAGPLGKQQPQSSPLRRGDPVTPGFGGGRFGGPPQRGFGPDRPDHGPNRPDFGPDHPDVGPNRPNLGPDRPDLGPSPGPPEYRDSPMGEPWRDCPWPDQRRVMQVRRGVRGR